MMGPLRECLDCVADNSYKLSFFNMYNVERKQVLKAPTFDQENMSFRNKLAYTVSILVNSVEEFLQ